MIIFLSIMVPLNLLMLLPSYKWNFMHWHRMIFVAGFIPVVSHDHLNLIETKSTIYFYILTSILTILACYRGYRRLFVAQFLLNSLHILAKELFIDGNDVTVELVFFLIIVNFTVLIVCILTAMIIHHISNKWQ